MPLTEKSNIRRNLSIGEVPYAPLREKSNIRRNMSIGEVSDAPYEKNPT